MKKLTISLIAIGAVALLIAAAPYDTRKFSDRYLLEKLNSDVGAITGVPNTRVITVDTAAVPVTGKVYTSIAAALTYIGTQTHDATHPWIINAGSTVNTTAASDLQTYTKFTSYRSQLAKSWPIVLDTGDALTVLAGANSTIGVTGTLGITASGAFGVSGSAVNVTGKPSNVVQTVTVADSGDGAAATSTVTPSSGFIEVTCSDSDGCTMTMSETGAVDGQTVNIVNVSANTATFADTSGVTEAAGSFAAGQWDSISYRYVVDRWVETARSNN